MLPALPPARRAFTDAALRPLGAPVVQRSTNTVVTGMTGAASAPPSPPTAEKEPPPSSWPKLGEPPPPSSPSSADGPPLSPPPGRPFERFDPHATDSARPTYGKNQGYRTRRIHIPRLSRNRRSHPRTNPADFGADETGNERQREATRAGPRDAADPNTADLSSSIRGAGARTAQEPMTTAPYAADRPAQRLLRP